MLALYPSEGTEVNRTNTFLDNDDGDDHTIDTENTGHDDWHNRLHDQLWLENTHGTDSDSSLCTSVGGTEVGKDEGGGDSDESEEVVVGISCFRHLDLSI
jgi:hypothetical protein